MEVYIFLFITAVIFTIVGYSTGRKSPDRAAVEHTVAVTIDGLIKDNYIKTQGTGDDMVILKWTEWNNDEAD